jgi:hypothetical protein
MTTPGRTSPDVEPDQRAVLAFHRNDDLDARPESHHHSIGQGRSQASPGNHIHDGTLSSTLLSTTITGSRANNMASIMDQLLNELTKIGLTNGTTP